MNRLSRYFPIVWVEPAVGWRESLIEPLYTGGRTQPTCKEPPSDLHVFNPRYLPKFYRPDIVATVIDKWRLAKAAQILKRKKCRKIVLYLWRPEYSYALDLIEHDVSFYHIDDEYSFSAREQEISQEEAELIKRVDRVVIHSPALLEKKGRLNPNTMYVPNGVEYQAYASPVDEPIDMRAIPHPRIGYTGVIKKQLDFVLLNELARRHSKWSFVFVGPRGNVAGKEAELAQLEKLPNVYMLGARPVDSLPGFVQHFDVGMLCYTVNDYTKYIYPLKMHEYLASGIPVIGTPIYTLQSYTNVVVVADSTDKWSRALSELIKPFERTDAKRMARMNVAKQHDWGVHAETISQSIRSIALTSGMLRN
jgi:glycosyltransferase involved in cell wall biosynthesis